MTGQPEREPLRGELRPVQLLAAEPDMPPSATETVRGGRRIGTQPDELDHLLDRAERGVLLPEETARLRELVRAQGQRLSDWKQAAGAGMTLADNLRTEIHALALGVPLVCSDDRHKTQVLSQAIRIRELEAERTNLLSVLTEAVDWIHDGDLRDRMLDAITPPRQAALCSCGRPDPGPCAPCPDNTPSLHSACDCTPAQAEHVEGAAGM